MHTGVRICRIRQCRQFLSLFSALCLKQALTAACLLLWRGIVCAGAAPPRAGGAGGAPWGRAATANHRQGRGGPGTPGSLGLPLTKLPHCALAGGSLCRVQDCRPRSKPHQTAPGTSQCHPSTLCCPAEPCCPWHPCSPLLLIHQCRGMLQRELGVLLFRAGAERWSILFSWSFSHSDPMVQQRPVQGSVEAGEDLD